MDDFLSGIQELTAANDPLKVLIYGKNKTGKTTLSATFEPPFLLLDINEKGTKPISQVKQGFKREINDYETMERGLSFLASGEHKFKTVILDNITNLQEVCLNYVLYKNDLEVDCNKTPGRNDYGAMATLTKRMLLNFRNLDMNVIFIAQEKSIQEEGLEDTGEISTFPAVSPSVVSFLGGCTDAILNTHTSETIKDGKTEFNYLVRLRSSKHLTGVRCYDKSYFVPPVVKNLTGEKLLKIMKGEI